MLMTVEVADGDAKSKFFCERICGRCKVRG